ncbi:hypothetical protein AB0B45_11345 [Nonomuraea sp. NPDC049152]|uniref:hypothetical protein n=1 Tax=Nonomuraea sp. NPDC049152 TaxID=3154350 RepID=UPI0033DB6BE1
MTLPVVLVSLGLGAVAFFQVPARYAASSSMILVAPPSGGTLSLDKTKPVGLTNPLLQYNDSMRTVAGILILTMNNPAIQKELGIVDGGPVKLTVDDGRSNAALMGITTAGPFVHVAVEAPSSATVLDTIARAEKRIRAELLNQQRILGAPTSTYIALNDVTTLEPKAVWGNTLVATFGAFGLGMAFGLGLAQLLVLRRGRAVPAAEEKQARPEPVGRKVTPPRKLNGKVLVFAEGKEKARNMESTVDHTMPIPVVKDDDDPENS